ncbi:MAG: phosphatase PAP2 family protein [Sphingobacteriales bacterium]|nr:MAG: phosphatase PAP2 family protein [Sphingobacteriales bacterium]
MTRVFLWVTFLLISSNLIAQKDSIEYSFTKPKPFSFITNVPRGCFQFVKKPFQKNSLKYTAAIAGATAVLILVDQPVYDGVRKFSDNIGLHPEENNKILWSIKTGNKQTVLLKAPGNLNTAFYMMGQGLPTLLIAGGLFIEGKIKHDFRSMQTASDLAESFITLGLTTQVAKWISGRENPLIATRRNGAWRPLPSFSEFQNNKPRYDAFPSGHLATLMATVTILANNYPEKKWIKPVGYAFTALCGYAMINNGVHWLGDYPLGLAMGYLSGKIITDRHKKKIVVNKLPMGN